MGTTTSKYDGVGRDDLKAIADRYGIEYAGNISNKNLLAKVEQYDAEHDPDKAPSGNADDGNPVEANGNPVAAPAGVDDWSASENPNSPDAKPVAHVPGDAPDTIAKLAPGEVHTTSSWRFTNVGTHVLAECMKCDFSHVFGEYDKCPNCKAPVKA